MDQGNIGIHGFCTLIIATGSEKPGLPADGFDDFGMQIPPVDWDGDFAGLGLVFELVVGANDPEQFSPVLFQCFDNLLRGH
jgi:hypothetical protein